MIIYHDDNLEVTHTVSYHTPNYDPHINGPNHVITSDKIPHERIHLEAVVDKAGARKIIASCKADLPIVALHDKVKLGADAIFMNVPKDTKIAINGGVFCTMDNSGTFELAPATPGFYKITFALKGYMTMENTVEVVRND